MSDPKADRLMADLGNLIETHGLDAVLLAVNVKVLREIQRLNALVRVQVRAGGA